MSAVNHCGIRGNKGLRRPLNIGRNFSRVAHYYDDYCAVQNKSGTELIGRITGDGYRRILDIGCGTGNFTKLLAERFDLASITAVDISPEMVGLAQEKLKDLRIEFVVGDAEVVDLSGQFDLISSNAALQWFGKIETVLARCRALLEEGGMIAFSAFGPDTFKELGESIRRLYGDYATISASGFADKVQIRRGLRTNFSQADVEEVSYREDYPSLRALLESIRYTGTRGSGVTSGRIWTGRDMDELEKVYKDGFERIEATYQVYYCKGIA